MAHEKSITKQLSDGRWGNFTGPGASSGAGRRLPGSFKTEGEASRAAKLRSQRFDPKTHKQTDKFGRKRKSQILK